MFGKDKPPPLKSLVAPGTVIRGDVMFEDGLRVDGEVHGQIMGRNSKPSVLVVGDGAQVNGEVSAEHVIINGRVQGPVTAHRLLELQPKAVIIGDVSYKAIELHLGAQVTGRLCPLVDGEPGPALDDADKPLTTTSSSGDQEPQLL